MTKGIYLFWDNKYEQVIYAGRFTGRKRIEDHFKHSRKYEQNINTYIQNHPDRIESVIFCEFDDISDNDLNQLEKETIKLFKLNKYRYPDNFVFNFTDGGEGVCGFTHTKKQRINKSKSFNTTGILNVYKKKDSKSPQGFIWKYQYYENGKRKSFGRTNLKDLKKVVKNKNLPWEITDIEKAEKSFNFDNNKKITRKNNKSGILNVFKEKSKNHTQGFRWTYQYYEKTKLKKIGRKNLKDLEKVVKNKNLPWEIVDEEKAKKSYAEN